MARISDPEVGKEEDNVELSLGLSIRSSSSFSFRTRPIWLSTSPPSQIEEKDPRSVLGSTASPILDRNGSNGGDFLNPKSKRDLLALRRQEARKKMEEKQQKKRNCNGNGDGDGNGLVDDRAVLEAQELQSRVRNRALKEAEASESQRNCKKDGEICRSDSADRNPNPNPSIYPSKTPFQVLPMQYRSEPKQFMPFSNGSQYPYIMPCWARASSSPASEVSMAGGGDVMKPEKNVIRPIGYRSFGPFQLALDPNQTLTEIPCCVADQNDGSMGSSSSAVSDNQSASLLGGSGSETRSHSSRYPLKQTQTHISPVHKAQSLTKHRALTLHSKSSRGAEEATDTPVLITAQSSPRKPEETIPVNEPISTTKSSQPKNPLPPTHMGFDGEENNKLKPSIPSLPQMPLVSTTGNGPNGKTITGFLYRYTKTKVSIICVCHGNPLSPEEFVKHAGGTDVSHPLRHIVVVPSTFG